MKDCSTKRREVFEEIARWPYRDEGYLEQPEVHCWRDELGMICQFGWKTHLAIRAPSACPLPPGSMRLPATKSFEGARPVGGANALDTASLSFRLNISR